MGEVRILGPIEVVVDGRPMAIGSLQLRRLLAVLAVNADEVVSTDRLVDVLWGDGAPMHASSTLSKSVYRLRSLIRDNTDGHRMLVTQPPGYVLRVDGQLDAELFARRVSEAKASLSGAEAVVARELLDEALALWRGPALGEFANDEFASAEVARLEGLRATALEDRGEIDLTLGRHAALIDDLYHSIAAYPLRERFRGQLMLALYRAGRQPEALRAYQDFREVLVDELGLEPSRELQQLDRAIVLRSAELDWTRPAAVSPAPSVRPSSSELPSGTVTFVFTDIEHSTHLSRRLGPVYRGVLERQRQVIRSVFIADGGVEVNVTGDGMLFAFGSAAKSMSACVSAQRALLAEKWPDGADVRVRMGLHTGEAEPAEGDYTALCLHEAARIVACAHGSQIIASQMTVSAAYDGQNDGVPVRSVGRFTLRDFASGVELFQLLHPDLPSEFPPPRQSVEAGLHTPLPAALVADRSPFVGRSLDLEWLDMLWRRSRGGESCVGLLSGSAGMGKSRLLAEFARRAHASGATVVQPHASTDVAGVLATVPGGVPTIVVGDDLEGPNDLASFTASVLSLRRDLNTLVVLAVRSGDGWEPALADVVRDRAEVVSRALAPLGADDVATMLVIGDAPPVGELVEAVMAETGGTPALVAAVAATLREQETARRVARALHRAESVRAELETLEDDIAAGVLGGARDASASAAVVSDTCPYKGLARFDVADADYYFGRDRLIATLVANLATSSFVAVIGASGSGKSSLVRAGLVAALARECLPGSSLWPVHVVRPGADPVGRLTREFGSLDLDDAVRRAVEARPSGTRALIVVDQFEELFTLCRDEEARTTCIEALTELDAQESPAAVVITLRADYYGSCAAHPALARLVERSQVLVGAMTASELRAAIVEPAHRAGLSVEPALVDAIVADVAEQPGMLPLASTALLETWTFRDGPRMTLAAYETAGGVRGALARLADRALDTLESDEQAAARRVFLRLAQLGEGNDDVSRRTTRQELGDDPITERVMDVLIAARLLTADGGTVEVAHEALLREWPRLRMWLEQDRDGRRIHRQLTDAAVQWDADGRDPSALYRGARLSAATEWATSHDEDINALEREFLVASSDLDQQEIRRARLTARRSREFAIGLSILLVVALAAGTLALVQRRNADHQASIAESTARHAQAGRLATLARGLGNDQTDLALLLGVEGHSLEPSVETEGGLESALVNVPPGIERIVDTGTANGLATPAPGDGRVMVARDDGGAETWDLNTGQRVSALQASTSPAILALASQDGRLVVIGHNNGDVEVLDAATGSPAGAPFHLGPEGAYAWFASADGSRLITVNQVPDSGHTQWQGILWDRSDPDRPKQVGDPFAYAVPPGFSPYAFADPSGSAFVGGNNATAPTTVWDIASHQQVAVLPISSPSPWPFPDGVTIAGAQAQRVVLVDRRTGAMEGDAFPPIDGGASSITVSRDGRQIAATSVTRKGTIVVFDVASRAEIGRVTLRAGAAPVEFLPDGRLVINAGSQLIVWRPGVTVPPLGVQLGRPMGPTTGIWSEDGRTIVTFHSSYGAVVDQPVLAFDGLTGTPKGPLLNHGSEHTELSTSPVALNPDATVAAIAGRDGVVRLRTVPSGEQVAELEPQRPGGELGVLWSPTGDRIATIGIDQSVLLWDVSDLGHPHRTGPPLVMPGIPAVNPVSIVGEFSRDGRSLLVVDAPHGNMTLFDVSTGAARWSVAAATFPWPGRLGYTSRSELVVPSGGAVEDLETGRTLALLDPATGKLVPSVAPPEIGQSADFLRDGSVLMVAGTSRAANGTDEVAVVRLYDTATGSLLGEPLPVGAVPVADKVAYFQAAGQVYPSPDGSRFISSTSGPGQSEVLWDVDLAHWEATACRIAGRNLTKAEWNQYLPGQPYHATCPQWPGGQ